MYCKRDHDFKELNGFSVSWGTLEKKTCIDSYHNILLPQGQDHISRRWMSVSHPARQHPPRPSAVKVQVSHDSTLQSVIKYWYSAFYATDLNFLDTVSHRDRSHTHQWVWLNVQSPLFTLLLLCEADAAPSHNTVLQWAPCIHTQLRWCHTITEHKVCFQCEKKQSHIGGGAHLHVRDLWGEPHSPAPAPDWRPCHPAEQIVYRSHLWREDRFPQKSTSWRVGSDASLFPVGQTASEE